MSKQEATEKKKKVSQADINAAILEHLEKVDRAQEDILQQLDQLGKKESNVLTVKERRARSSREAREQNIKLSDDSGYVSDSQLQEQEANLLNQATRSRNTVLYGTIDEVREINGTPVAFVTEEHDKYEHRYQRTYR